MRFKRLSVFVNEVKRCLHLEKDFTTALSRFTGYVFFFFAFIPFESIFFKPRVRMDHNTTGFYSSDLDFQMLLQ